jgi:hypothetical protein
VIQTVIHLDSLKPRAELRASLEAPKAEECLDEDLLRQVFGVSRRARDDPAIGHDMALVTTDEFLERTCVSVVGGPGLLD